MNKDSMLCFCNMVTVKDFIEIVKKEKIVSIKDIENKKLMVGDKCGSCLYDNELNVNKLLLDIKNNEKN